MHHGASTGPQHGNLQPPEAAIIEEAVQGTPAMIPADQKQLNIAFPKLTMSYVARKRYRTVRIGKQLYSVAAKLPQR
jgi:hypothetical protein